MAGVTCEGNLLKEGAGLVKAYKKRWFVLKNQELQYFRDKTEKEPTGSISLANTKVNDNPAIKFGIAISGPSLARVYNLAAESEAEKQRWIKAISQAQAVAGAVGDDAKDQGEEMIFNTPGSQKVGLKDFEVIKVIGRGSFGKVMKVKHRGTGQIFAMKALRKDVVVREGMVANTKAEKAILQTIDHPYIVKLHYAFQTKERLYLILDLLPGGELFFHLKNEGKFIEPRAKMYAAEIASALAHLHDHGIVYRDLKPENIVLDSQGHACITDMGLAKTSMASQQQTYTFCGTPEYIAPEMLKGTGHNKGVDWWALGILVYEMLVGLPPFYSENVNEMYELILNKPLEFPPHVPKEARDLISRLLERDPTKRLTDGDAILKSPWFASVDFDKLLKKELTPMWVPDLTGDDEKYVEDEFKEQSTKATIFHGEATDDASFTGFTYQSKPALA